jgi:hypothetical protein
MFASENETTTLICQNKKIMKNFLRQAVLTSTLIIALAVPALAKATNNALVYDRSINSSIGISVDNATGHSYQIKDRKGRVVLSGKIKSVKTFYIATGKLEKGSYTFTINGNTLQEFIIK